MAIDLVHGAPPDNQPGSRAARRRDGRGVERVVEPARPGRRESGDLPSAAGSNDDT
jgi:hypothetical protein